MGKFTAGERRGLIVLMVILAALCVVMFTRSYMSSHTMGELSINEERAAVRFDSVSRSDSVFVQDSLKVRRKRKNKASKSKMLPPRRNPLDEELN